MLSQRNRAPRSSSRILSSISRRFMRASVRNTTRARSGHRRASWRRFLQATLLHQVLEPHALLDRFAARVLAHELRAVARRKLREPARRATSSTVMPLRYGTSPVRTADHGDLAEGALRLRHDHVDWGLRMYSASRASSRASCEASCRPRPCPRPAASRPCRRTHGHDHRKFGIAPHEHMDRIAGSDDVVGRSGRLRR